MTSSLSPFRWAEFPRPSIFAGDRTFTGASTTGKTLSQTSSEWVDRVTKETGRSPGSIHHLSSTGDRLIEDGNYRRAKTRLHKGVA